MGMTPLAGLMMGTRCGDLDPSVVNYLKYNLEITGHELDEILNKKSGLLGVSGVSSDKRDVEEAAMNGNKRAQLASDMLNYQIKKTIGSYIAAMGGVDAIVFTGGIGEHDAEPRCPQAEEGRCGGHRLGCPRPHADHRDQRGADDCPRHEGSRREVSLTFLERKVSKRTFNIFSRERVLARGCGMGFTLCGSLFCGIVGIYAAVCRERS